MQGVVRAAYRSSMRVTNSLSIDERDLEEQFVRASGPGGQNVNKVASAVQLRFDVRHSGLPEDVKARLVSLAGHRMTARGVLVIDAREERTQAANRNAARARLAALVARAARRPTARRPTRPSGASKVRRLDEKRRHGDKKRSRSGRRADE